MDNLQYDTVFDFHIDVPSALYAEVEGRVDIVEGVSEAADRPGCVLVGLERWRKPGRNVSTGSNSIEHLLVVYV